MLSWIEVFKDYKKDFKGLHWYDALFQIAHLEIWCHIYFASACPFFFSFCKNEVWNSAASSSRCGSPPLVNLFMGFPYYREAADDPNSRASSQASRKDKEAGISAQFFSRWQFKEHKRREKEKVMERKSDGIIILCFFFLFVLILSFCGSCLS